MSVKDACPDCGDDMYVAGPIIGPRTGEDFQCENENCEYSEQRYYD